MGFLRASGTCQAFGCTGVTVDGITATIFSDGPDEDAVIAFARERLAGYKVPRSVDVEDELPRHPTGKLYTRLLRDRYWEQCTLFDVTYRPKLMSVKDLEQGLEYLMGALYTPAETLRRRRLAARIAAKRTGRFAAVSAAKRTG